MVLGSAIARVAMASCRCSCTGQLPVARARGRGHWPGLVQRACHATLALGLRAPDASAAAAAGLGVLAEAAAGDSGPDAGQYPARDPASDSQCPGDLGGLDPALLPEAAGLALPWNLSLMWADS